MADTIRRLIQRSDPTCIPISNLVCKPFPILASRSLPSSSSSSSSQQRSQTLSPPPPIRVRLPFSVRRWPAHSYTLGISRPAFRRFDARLPSARLRLTTPVSACSAPAHLSASVSSSTAISPARSRRSLLFHPQFDIPVAIILFPRLSLPRPTDGA